MEDRERELTTDDLASGGERRTDVAEADRETTERDRRDEVAEDIRAEEAETTTSEPLFAGAQSDEFRQRWETVQTGFVDEPRRAVEQADALVADLMQRLAGTFSEERKNLEGQWDRGDDVSTEDLRVALQRYRSFFDRLLSA
jgi:hypothetical protein